MVITIDSLCAYDPVGLLCILKSTQMIGFANSFSCAAFEAAMKYHHEKNTTHTPCHIYPSDPRV